MAGRLGFDMSLTVTLLRRSMAEVLAEMWPDFRLW